MGKRKAMLIWPLLFLALVTGAFAHPAPAWSPPLRSCAADSALYPQESRIGDAAGGDQRETAVEPYYDQCTTGVELFGGVGAGQLIHRLDPNQLHRVIPVNWTYWAEPDLSCPDPGKIEFNISFDGGFSWMCMHIISAGEEALAEGISPTVGQVGPGFDTDGDGAPERSLNVVSLAIPDYYRASDGQAWLRLYWRPDGSYCPPTSRILVGEIGPFGIADELGPAVAMDCPTIPGGVTKAGDAIILSWGPRPGIWAPLGEACQGSVCSGLPPLLAWIGTDPFDNLATADFDLYLRRTSDDRLFQIANGLQGSATNYTWTVPSSLPTGEYVARAVGRDSLGNAGYFLPGASDLQRRSFSSTESCPFVVQQGGCAPACDATATPTTGATPLQVQFWSFISNGCAGTPSFWWSFGDGQGSSEPAPTHVYEYAGIYSWSLAVAFQEGTCTTVGEVTVSSSCKPHCTTTISPLAGIAPLAVQFSAATAGPACTGDVSFLWDFGDGQTSTLQDPNHTYLSPGSYRWSVTVSQQGANCVQSGGITVGSGAACNSTGVEVVSSVSPGEVVHRTIAGQPNRVIPLAWYYTADPELGCPDSGSMELDITVDGGYSWQCLHVLNDVSNGWDSSWTSGREEAIGAGLPPQVGQVGAGTDSDGDGDLDRSYHTLVVAIPDYYYAQADMARLRIHWRADGTLCPMAGRTRVAESPLFQIADELGPTVVVECPAVPHGVAVPGSEVRLSWTNKQGLWDRIGTSCDGIPCTGTDITRAWRTNDRFDNSTTSSFDVYLHGVSDSREIWIAGPLSGTATFCDWTVPDGIQDGEYTVRVVGRDPSGNSSYYVPPFPDNRQSAFFMSVESCPIHISSQPCELDCEATATPTVGKAPLQVHFSATISPDHCTGSPSFVWDYGDGTGSSSREAAHTYSDPGLYTWTLTASIQGSICLRTGQVRVEGPCSLECAATAVRASCLDRSITFVASVQQTQCTGQPEYRWAFGDGESSGDAQPVHTYSSAGDFTWELELTQDGSICNATGTARAIDPLHADAGQDRTFCNGAPVILGGSPTGSGGTGTISYEWSPAIGLDDHRAANPRADPDLTTVYTVLVSDPSDPSCTASDSVLITLIGDTAPPLPPSQLAAKSGVDCRITLKWIPSPSPDTSVTNIYWDAGSGNILEVPLVSLPPGETTWTSSALVPGLYKFDVRALDACGILSERAAAAGVHACSTTCLDLNENGRSICSSENCHKLTFNATNPGGCYEGQNVQSLLFQYRHCDIDPWINIISCNPSTKNPQNSNPSGKAFLHWDLEGLDEGCYQVRVLPTIDDIQIADVPYATLLLDCEDPDSKEGRNEKGQHELAVKTFALTGQSVECGDPSGADEDAPDLQPTTFTIPPGALNSDTRFRVTFPNPDDPTLPSASAPSGSGREFRLVSMDSGQALFPEGKSLRIEVAYQDSDGDGFVDRTAPPVPAADLRLFHYDGSGWEALKDSISHTSRTVVSATSDVGGLFGLFADISFTPGDCDGNGRVNIGEVQKAINMFLGSIPPECGVDCNRDGQVSIGELQKVINAFLGLPSGC